MPNVAVKPAGYATTHGQPHSPAKVAVTMGARNRCYQGGQIGCVHVVLGYEPQRSARSSRAARIRCEMLQVRDPCELEIGRWWRGCCATGDETTPREVSPPHTVRTFLKIAGYQVGGRNDDSANVRGEQQHKLCRQQALYELWRRYFSYGTHATFTYLAVMGRKPLHNTAQRQHMAD